MKLIYRQQGIDEHYKLLHKTSQNMIIYIEKGFGSIVTNEKSYPLKPGVLCFIGAGKYHYTMPESPDSYIRSKVFVPTKELQKILSFFSYETASLFSEDNIVFSEIPQNEMTDVQNLFEEINCYNDTQYSDANFISNYAKLLIQIHKNMRDTITPPSSFITRAIDYINTNLTEDITIDDICKKIHVSKYHFCREFKKVTGFTVMDYILKTRIVIAKSLLRETDKSISEISETCGFSSISYFCRIFKNETTLTPLKYRKNKQR